MVRILVVYDSITGNTKKMASAVADGAKQVVNVEVTVKKVDDVKLKDLLKADGIIMGSPTYYGQMSGKLKSFIDTSVKIHGKLAGKAGGAFTTSGGAACGAETTLLSILNAMLVSGMVIQGMHEYNHYGAASVGAPGTKETKSGKMLGKKVAELAMKLSAR